jgi:hypothetical protein
VTAFRWGIAQLQLEIMLNVSILSTGNKREEQGDENRTEELTAKVPDQEEGQGDINM